MSFTRRKDALHGDFRLHPYHSKITGSWRAAFVYTPPGYDAGNALQNESVKHVYYESPGTAHQWQTWRRDLIDFAPRLFRK